jgi:signal transduction histidine kinase/ligand-binding sensor domain-containing protein
MVCRESRSAYVARILIAVSCFVCVTLQPSVSVGAVNPRPLLLTQLDHTVWTTRDGAPNSVYSIALDHNDTLWLATEGGLYQFNGLQFSEFHAPDGEPALPEGAHSFVFVAKNGDIWVGSLTNGIARIRGGHVLSFDERQGFPPRAVMWIKEGQDGSIWAVVHRRLMLLEGDHWINAGALMGIESGGVNTVFFDHEGTQWVSVSAGARTAIYYRPQSQKQFLNAAATLGPATESANFAESKTGELWIALANELTIARTDLQQLDVPGHKAKSPKIIHLPFEANMMTFAGDGSLWVAGSSELQRFEPTTTGGTPGFSREIFGIAEGLTSKNVSDILEDRNGDMWLTTGSGIERFRQPVLVRYVDRRLDPSILSLSRDAEGTIWIGQARAPILSVRADQTVEHGSVVSDAEVVFHDSHGVLWLRSQEGMLREEGNHLTKIGLPKGIPSWAADQFFESKSGDLYVDLSSSGVYRYARQHWFKVDLPDQPHDAPYSRYLDTSDRIWIAYVGGKVGMVDGNGGHVYSVGTDVDLGSVETFLETPEGFLCGGLNGIALLRGDHFEVLPTSDPNATKGISGMVQAPNGDLWLNGIHGVSRISSSDLQAAISGRGAMPVQQYQQTEIRGPSPQAFGFPTAVSDATGRLWFNTSGAIAYVDPKSVSRNTRPPTLVLSGIEQDGQPVGQQNRVKAGASTVRIRYFGANLLAPEKVKYLYWLHGVDKTWQDVDRRTEAVYTHLGPGKYLFEVKATNGEGVWSAPISATLSVLPAFYQTVWFAVLCAISGILLLWLGLTARLRYLTAGIRQRAEERADERVRIARELHDTLLQGIQGLLLTFHVAAEKVPADHVSRIALDKALTTADRIIVEGRNRVSRLRSEKPTDAELKTLIEGVAGNLNGMTAIEFSVERTGRTDILKSHVVDEIFCIAREALTNAFRHSGASRIVVELDYKEKEFRMSCCDNGRGFDAEALRAGEKNGHWGLRGMEERAENIGAALSLRSAASKGTDVRITLPAHLAYVRRHRFGFLFKRDTAT